MNLKIQKKLNPSSPYTTSTIFDNILNEDRIVSRCNFNSVDIYKVNLYSANSHYHKIITYDLSKNVIFIFPSYAYVDRKLTVDCTNNLFSKYTDFFKIFQNNKLSTHSTSDSGWDFISFTDNRICPSFVYKGNELIKIDLNTGIIHSDTLYYTKEFKSLLSYAFLLLTDNVDREKVESDMLRDVKRFRDHRRYQEISNIYIGRTESRLIDASINEPSEYYCLVKITNGKNTSIRYSIHRPYCSFNLNMPVKLQHSQFMRKQFKKLTQNQYLWTGKNKKGSENSVLRLIKLDHDLIKQEWNSEEIKLLSKISQLTNRENRIYV